jgi:hypothetical protein
VVGKVAQHPLLQDGFPVVATQPNDEAYGVVGPDNGLEP